MLDRQFDNIIKSKLSGVQTETTPDWELFAQKQRAAQAVALGKANEPSSVDNDLPFDEAVVKTIETYIDKSVTPNWSAFLKKKTIADAEASKVDKANEGFDIEVKTKVDNYVSASQPDWKTFQSFNSQKQERNIQEDQSIIEDTSFDSQIREELEGYITTSSPQWSQLAELKKVADDDAIEIEKHQEFDEAIRAGILAFTLDPKMPLGQPQWNKYKEYKSIISDNSDFSDFNDLDDFDLEVKKEIENYKTSTQPDWANFLEKKKITDQDAIDINKHKDFDEAIRAGTLAFTLDPKAPLSQPQWATFLDTKARKEQALDNDNFDKEVKAEVDNYIAPQAAQWSAFLDNKSSLNANYDNQHFDEEIEQTLVDHKSNSTPQWSKFKEDKKRKEKAIADGQFDNGLSGSLGKLKVRYNSEHWLLLRGRLQNIAQLRKNIFSYKSLEIVFTLLMFLTFANFYGPLMDKIGVGDILVIEKTEKNSDRPSTTSTTSTTNNDTKDVVNKLEEAPTNSIKDAIRTSESKSNSSTLDNNKTIRSISSETSLQKSNSNDATNKVISDNSEGGLVVNNNSTENQIPNSSNIAKKLTDKMLTDKTLTKDRLPVEMDEKSNLDDALIAGATTGIVENEDVVVRGLMNSLEAIESGGIGFLSGDEVRKLRQPKAPVYIDLSIKKTYLDEGSWVHFFAGIENNYIRTPLLQTNPDDQLTYITNDKNGYNFEVLYSKVKGRLEFETGLGYNFVNYKPYVENPITYTNVVPREVTFSQVRLDMVSVPLRAKHHFVSNGRWSVFGHAGLTNDLILRTGYSIDDSPKPVPTQVTNPTVLPDFYNAEFTVGLFGDLPQSPPFVNYTSKSNVYILRGQLGLGAERNISDNLAAYLRADYSHTLHNSDIGPLNDRINKVAIGMGFKYRLK